MAKNLMLLVLMIVLLPLGSLHAQQPEPIPDAIPGCDAQAVDYFWSEVHPVMEDYARLREAFVQNGDFGVTGGELIVVRETLEKAIMDSPACLDGLALDLVMSVGNMQTAVLFLILSFEIDDAELRASLGDIGSHYAQRSDAQFQAASETIAGWGIDPLARADRSLEDA